MPHVNEVYVIGGAHNQHADEQLANLQKRIYLIEFLHLGLIIGCQGAMLPLPYFCQGFFFPPPQIQNTARLGGGVIFHVLLQHQEFVV